MKQIYLLTAFFFLTSISSNAQITDVVNPATGGPTGFSFSGNDLYYTQFAGAIVKIDATAPTPTTPINVISGLSDPEGIVVAGNIIYFTQSANKISKIDITATTPVIIDVATGLNEPNGMVLNGNDLYIAEIGSGKISKIDITDPTPANPVDVITGLNTPLGLALNGNDLYIVEVDGNKVSKIDITANTPVKTDVVIGLNKPLYIQLSGTVLYISEADGNKISKIDITASTPTTTTTLVTVDSPECIALHGDDLYYSAFPDVGPTIIGKINLAPLSITENLNKETVKIYPNPTTDYIQISGVTEEMNYTIYDLLGKEITTGIISAQNKVDVQDLSNGIYFLKFTKGTAIKFVKE